MSDKPAKPKLNPNLIQTQPHKTDRTAKTFQLHLQSSFDSATFAGDNAFVADRLTIIPDRPFPAGGDDPVMADDTLRELRQLAAHLMQAERQGHTLTPTALVNETVVRLLKSRGNALSAGETLALSTVVMRRVLIDHARARRARPDRSNRACLETASPASTVEQDPAQLAELEDVATVVQAMAKVSPRAARALQLRYWHHLTIVEAAKQLEISPALLKAEVAWAKKFIRDRLQPSTSESGSAKK